MEVVEEEGKMKYIQSSYGKISELIWGMFETYAQKKYPVTPKFQTSKCNAFSKTWMKYKNFPHKTTKG